MSSYERDNASTKDTVADQLLSIRQLVAPLLRRDRLYADEEQMIGDLLAAGVTLEQVAEGIRQSFATYKPRHTGDRIYKLTYCRTRILQGCDHAQLQCNKSLSRAEPGRSGGISPLVQPGKYDQFYELYKQRDEQVKLDLTKHAEA